MLSTRKSEKSIPSGKGLHNYGKSHFLMGKLTISMAIFNSFLYVYQRVVVSKEHEISAARSPKTQQVFHPNCPADPKTKNGSLVQQI